MPLSKYNRNRTVLFTMLPYLAAVGLETGWNCAISLMPRNARHAPVGAAVGVSAAAAFGSGRSEKASGGLGQFGLDDDEEDFGVDGILTDEKRSRLLRNAVDEQVM